MMELLRWCLKAGVSTINLLGSRPYFFSVCVFAWPNPFLLAGWWWLVVLLLLARVMIVPCEFVHGGCQNPNSCRMGMEGHFAFGLSL